MSQQSKYVLDDTEGKRCIGCGNTAIGLLCREDGTMSTSRESCPAFYICWWCFRVFQVGVGFVGQGTMPPDLVQLAEERKQTAQKKGVT